HNDTRRKSMSGISVREASTTRLGKTGIVVSRLGVGTGSWGKNQIINLFGSTDSPAAEADALKVSLKAGVTLFDTATQYKGGNSERRLGEIANGTAAIVASKYLPRSQFGPRPDSFFPKALGASLKRLKRTSIDLYQIHFPPPFS